MTEGERTDQSLRNWVLSPLQNITFQAMTFAMEAHEGHKRNYTGEPYFKHLAEVAGMVSTLSYHDNMRDTVIPIAWLHDCMEDCGVTYGTLGDKFGFIIAKGVFDLSDLEKGNRETRKRLSRERLSKAPWYIQNIKICDLISNTSSIVAHDPKFAKIYLEEKRLLLEVLTEADKDLLDIALNMLKQDKENE
jgi:guanosine-3',5'-bis(diphosphate) 3'-pyrophosphohydrolase